MRRQEDDLQDIIFIILGLIAFVCLIWAVWDSRKKSFSKNRGGNPIVRNNVLELSGKFEIVIVEDCLVRCDRLIIRK